MVVSKGYRPSDTFFSLFSFLESMFYGTSSSSILNSDYHLYLMVGLTVILGAVLYLFFKGGYDSYVDRGRVDALLSKALTPDSNLPSVPASRYFTECHRSEELWVILFTIVIFVQGFSYGFNTLYASGLPENSEKVDLTVQAIGNQWYWVFTYPDFADSKGLPLSLEVRKLNDGDENPNFPPLKGFWEVNKRLFLPNGNTIRFLVTADDVLHSLFMRELDVKIDTVPGRINEVYVTPNLPGLFPGYCTELCGSGHGFMPFAVNVVHPLDFLCWIKYQSLLTAIDNPSSIADTISTYKFEPALERQTASFISHSAFWLYFMEELTAHPFWADSRYDELMAFLSEKGYLLNEEGNGPLNLLKGMVNASSEKEASQALNPLWASHKFGRLHNHFITTKSNFTAGVQGCVVIDHLSTSTLSPEDLAEVEGQDWLTYYAEWRENGLFEYLAKRMVSLPSHESKVNYLKDGLYHWLTDPSFRKAVMSETFKDLLSADPSLPADKQLQDLMDIASTTRRTGANRVEEVIKGDSVDKKQG
jgi:heme/copper-type cytochrome/quinol oxidase subunit 2